MRMAVVENVLVYSDFTQEIYRVILVSPFLSPVVSCFCTSREHTINIDKGYPRAKIYSSGRIKALDQCSPLCIAIHAIFSPL